MQFLDLPQLPSLDISTIAAGKAGRLVLDTISGSIYYDNGTKWVEIVLASQIAQVQSQVNNIMYSTIGVFGGGGVSNTSVYTYSSNSSVAGGNLTALNNSNPAGTSTASTGVIGGGTTSIYTYSSNSAVAGATLVYFSANLAASGNSTIGVFGSGDGNSTNSTSTFSSTSLYTYSSNTSIAGTNLTYSGNVLSAVGNSAIAVFGGGYILSTTSIYTYSSNVAVAGSNLTYSAYGMGGASTSSLGVFGAGNNGSSLSVTSVYIYSSNAVIAGGNLTFSNYYIRAISSGNVGVYCGGPSASSVTSIYTFSNNTAMVGANLDTAYTSPGTFGPTTGVNC